MHVLYIRGLNYECNYHKYYPQPPSGVLVPLALLAHLS